MVTDISQLLGISALKQLCWYILKGRLARVQVIKYGTPGVRVNIMIVCNSFPSQNYEILLAKLVVLK